MGRSGRTLLLSLATFIVAKGGNVFRRDALIKEVYHPTRKRSFHQENCTIELLMDCDLHGCSLS